MIKRSLLLTFAITSSIVGSAHVNPVVPLDTTRVVDIEEAVIVASPKETTKLRRQPTSVSLISASDLKTLNAQAIKNLSGFVPNFYMPDYGSRITSAVYIRGIGSRINTPAVGLYVDNLPFIDKSAYDFSFMDVERVDVLRGPQGTLYGRNTMGGLIRVFTRDPFRHQGTEIKIGASTRNEGRKASVSTYQKVSDRFAFSVGGFYEGNNGFFRNDSTGKKVDNLTVAGGRIRGIYKFSDRLKFDVSANYEYTNQGGYPYVYEGTVKGTEQYPDLVGGITPNRENGYRRNLLNSGVNVEYKAKNFILNSFTGYQYLNDRMMLDQDFIIKDIYTLQQKQREHLLSEELTLKSKPGKRWQWTTGVFGSYQALRTEAPVCFYSDGMAMLNKQISGYMPTIQMGTMPLKMDLAITDSQMNIDGTFNNPVANYALFHQSVLHDLFVENLSLTLGLRLDYEHQEMNYNSGGNSINYDFNVSMLPQPAHLACSPQLTGKLKDDYLQLLPKFALQYDLKKGMGNVYLAFSKGYRSGGYNIQMYSDLIQDVMKNRMMSGVKGYCDNVFQQLIDNAPTEAQKERFRQIKNLIDSKIPEGTDPEVAASVTFKPEYSWNYEAGTHLNLLDRRLQADIAFFFMDTYDQQIARYVQSGLGRAMANAGHSHSCGVEICLRNALFDNRLTWSANYGFTHATFKEYNDGKNDYSGNKVPFVPAHTFGLAANYMLPLEHCWINKITLGANMNGVGRIYWTEMNNAYQNFYATLGANVNVDFGKFSVNVWGKNLTCSKYNSFYFESMNRAYTQKGNPFQLGIDVSIHL